MVMLDTATLVFWTLNNKRLSPRAKLEINEADRICISAISIWEIGVKVDKKKLALPITVAEFAVMVEQTTRVEILPVDVRTWIRNLDLDWDHRDPADRTIVAAASLQNCTLLTPDRLILDFYSQAIW